MRIRLFPSRLWGRAVKRWAPTSLFGRSLLIIVLPVALMQVAVTWAFFEAHWRISTTQLSDALAGDIAWDVAEYEANPNPEALARLADRAERTQSLNIAFRPEALPSSPPRSRVLPTFDHALKTALEDRLKEDFWVDANRYPKAIDIRVKVNGGVLRIIAPRSRAFAARGQVFIMWMTGATVLLTAVAVLFIRNQVRAIERLAAAAEAFGRGEDVKSFKPHGAREVRQAATAFLAMKARIQRHIEQRTTMLAAVSHDLRTPLTRLKLAAELAEPSPRMEAIKGDLADMEHMIDEYLDFARGEGIESMETTLLRPLLEEIAADAHRAGAEVAVEAAPDSAARLRPVAIKRALSNLALNAAAHAKSVRLSAEPLASGGLLLAVDDDGPGIAPEHYAEALKPFSRLDQARNQNAKGVGLGLAIARDVARSHGGDLSLSKSELGGLRAAIRLPG
ncbi:MAG: ATP-binding protein [Pseudomonadota bacterium]|jgi:two-component system osmolarity sensor histidine kinase EnvZ